HGASCRLSGEVSPALSATNPHQFDYQNYLWQQGIQAQFLISHIEDIECENKSIRSSIYYFRQFLKEITENTLSENAVQWIHAILCVDCMWTTFRLESKSYGHDCYIIIFFKTKD